MIQKSILFILLCLTLGMTSCSLDDELMTDNEQVIVQASNTTDPSPEHEGDDEELEPNN